MPISQVSVLAGSTDNHTMVLAGCAEVSCGHKGQRWGWGRMGLQEVDHEGHRGAQCWFICRRGSAELALVLVRVGVSLGSPGSSLSTYKTHPTDSPATPLPPLYPLLSIPIPIPTPVSSSQCTSPKSLSKQLSGFPFCAFLGAKLVLTAPLPPVSLLVPGPNNVEMPCL